MSSARKPRTGTGREQHRLAEPPRRRACPTRARARPRCRRSGASRRRKQSGEGTLEGLRALHAVVRTSPARGGHPAAGCGASRAAGGAARRDVARDHGAPTAGCRRP
jgi:hypothetical protein